MMRGAIIQAESRDQFQIPLMRNEHFKYLCGDAEQPFRTLGRFAQSGGWRTSWAVYMSSFAARGGAKPHINEK
jgi:hypothetical protein